MKNASEAESPAIKLTREEWERLRDALKDYNKQIGKWPRIRYDHDTKEISVRLGDRENAVVWTVIQGPRLS
jgi:hypothetical protein